MASYRIEFAASAEAGVCFRSSEFAEVTIRERDSMDQVRVPIAGLVEALQERLA